MTTDVHVYVIEDNKLVERYYLGMTGVLHHFPQGHFSMNGFLKLVTIFIHEIREETEVGYADAWITSDLLYRPELEDEILDFIQAHPKANFQIRWE